MKSVIFIISFLLLLVTPANAQGLSLGLYPPILEINATPPANVETPLEIENLDNEEVDLNIIFKPFTASDLENGEIRYLGEGELRAGDPLIFQRIRILDQGVPIRELTLSPGQRKELKVTIDLPRGSVASDYYFSIVFVSKVKDAKTASGPQITGGVATNVLLSVGKDGPPRGNIVEFSSPFFVERGPVPFTVRVKNSSNFLIAPRGEIIIKNIFGQIVGRVDLLPVNILAGSVRAIPSESTSNNLSASGIEAVWKDKFILGPYKAHLTLAISEEGPLFKREIMFFAFPYSWFAGLIAALLVIWFVASRVRRKI